jgi:N-acetyltransferase 10
MRKKISELVRQLFEISRAKRHRSVVVIIGDRAKDQVINLYNLWLSIRNTQAQQLKSAHPKILWCYKHELGFSSHQQKRKKELTKRMKQGLYESESDNPFELFLTSSDIRFCYYKDTASILGSTYEALVFQDFESLTANILCRTIETVAGGGVVFFMLKSMTSLKQLYSMAMDVHNRFRTDAFAEIHPLFNERMMLSLAVSDSVLFMDDELNMIQQGQDTRIEMNQLRTGEAVLGLEMAERSRLELLNSVENNKTIHAILKLTQTIDQAKVVLFLLDSTVNRSLKSKGQSLSNLLLENRKCDVVFMSAGRGRGKSAALGLAIAGSLACNCGNVTLSAASAENVKTVFEFVVSGLETLGFHKNNDFSVQFDEQGNVKSVVLVILSGETGPNSTNSVANYFRQSVSFVHPTAKIDNTDLLVIDEAAAIPLLHVKNMVKSTNCPVFISSTIHGYEGSGRSLSLKLIEELRRDSGKSSCRVLKEVEMLIPIRYALLDPIEEWLHSFLCLDSTSASPLKNAMPHPKDCGLFFVNKTTLFSYHKSSEQFLKNLWSLFVSSHYKNSPNDLQMLADAPSHAVAVLLGPIDTSQERTSMPDILVSVQLCFEGGIKQTTMEDNAQRGLRPSGDLVPWALYEQFLDRSLFSVLGVRVIRIATHPAAARMGYGSRALQLLRDFFQQNTLEGPKRIDWNSFVNHQTAPAPADTIDSAERVLLPKRQLPSLLKKSTELDPPSVQYLSVSYGMTRELFKFWDKNGFSLVHLKHSKNEVTGENNAIMLCPVVTDNINFAFFFSQFRKRFVSLLSWDFRELEVFTALQILKPNLATSENEESHDKNVQPGLVLSLFGEFDLARLEAYSNNSVEYYIIKDMTQRLAELFFCRQFSSDVKLSLAQAVILLGMCLQKRSAEEMADILKVDHPQVLALFNKTIKKFTLKIREKVEVKTADGLQLKTVEDKVGESKEFEPLKNQTDELIGTLRKKNYGQSVQKGGKRVKMN